ncbi:MAG: Xaa-Pro peptidase family protein [Trueperaceae bacterium]|nr:Xaa-Pro peptidase family protein [Trueperaceae bacterium]
MTRLDKLREQFEACEIDALLVTYPANVRYLSDFSTPTDGRVLITPDEALLLTDGRYTAQAAEESSLQTEIISHDWLGWLGDKLGERRLGFEAQHVTVTQLGRFRDVLQCEPVETTALVGTLRLHKTEAEIELLRKAARITDRAFSEILDAIKPGVREIDVALELERIMRSHGAEDISFDIIVASGVRSAMPHGVASTKPIGNNEFVTLDFGAVVGGYHADMTRTVAVGKVSDDLRAIYDAVLDAEQQALDAIAPGKNGQDIDLLARRVLDEAGYGEYFSHSLGHGVGLEIHEGPRLSRHVAQVLEPTMTVTIEPGVYIPDQAGVRIEDLAVITGDGFERLSHSDKQLIEL